MKQSVTKETKAIAAASKRSHAGIRSAMVGAAKRFGATLDLKSLAVAGGADVTVVHAAPRKQSGAEEFTSFVAFTKKVRATSGDLHLKPGIYRLRWLANGQLECHDVAGHCVGVTTFALKRESAGAGAPTPNRIRLSGSFDWEKVCVDLLWGHFYGQVCWYW